MENRPLVECQRWLCGAWILGALPPITVMAVQTLNNFYGAQDQDAWGWLLTSIMPTMSLVIGSYISCSTDQAAGKKTVDLVVFILAVSFSAIYLAFINGIMFFMPFSNLSPLETMHRLNLLLGALQGIVGTCLGVFLTRHGKAPSRASATRVANPRG